MSALFVAIAHEQGGAVQLRLPECLPSGVLEIALRPSPAALPRPRGETFGELLALEQGPERRPERRLDGFVLPVERGISPVRVADAAAEAQLAVVDLLEHPAASRAGEPRRPARRIAVLGRRPVQRGVARFEVHCLSLILARPVLLRKTSHSLDIASGIAASSSTQSGWSRAIAFAGMAEKSASSGSWTIKVPPTEDTKAAPATPSASVPESTTATTREP